MSLENFEVKSPSATISDCNPVEQPVLYDPSLPLKQRAYNVRSTQIKILSPY